MSDMIKWGILGTGRISRAFAEGLKYTPNGVLHGVASRNHGRSKTYAEEWNVPLAFENYRQMAESEAIDAVYVATPHTQHAENSILCMNNGKAVLCEKPFAVNHEQAKEMVTHARKNNVLLMEGMWSRCPPLMEVLRKTISSGEIGEVRTLHADFGFKPKTREPEGRLLNPNLAGGSLLDIGIYPISLASMVMGKPKSCFSDWPRGPTGIDEQASCILKYDNGSMALLHSSLESETTRGVSIRHRGKYSNPQTMLETPKDDGHFDPFPKGKTVEMPFEGNGFNYEAEFFGELLLEGKRTTRSCRWTKVWKS